MMYGDSPFIYPLYGLGDLPQGFARLVRPAPAPAPSLPPARPVQHAKFLR